MIIIDQFLNNILTGDKHLNGVMRKKQSPLFIPASEILKEKQEQEESKSISEEGSPASEQQSKRQKNIEGQRTGLIIEDQLIDYSYKGQRLKKLRKYRQDEEDLKDKSKSNEIERLRAQIKQLEKEDKELELKLKAKEGELKVQENELSRLLEINELSLSFSIEDVDSEWNSNQNREESANIEKDSWAEEDSEVQQQMEKWLQSRQKLTKEEFVACSPRFEREESGNQFQSFTYKSLGEEQICFSCLAILKRGENCVYLPCSHIFHIECGKKIYRFLKYCPGCGHHITPASN